MAGAFLALAALAWALAGPRRVSELRLTIAALAPIALLALAFPEGGSQPFVASAFYPALAGVLLIAAADPPGRGRRARAARAGSALLYALALTGSFVLATAVGGNADRLGALAAGPIAACVLAGAAQSKSRRHRSRRASLVAFTPLLFYWQANAPVADFASAASDPAAQRSYYTPLLSELRTLGVGYSARPARIEVVPTVDHWEARLLAPHVMIAARLGAPARHRPQRTLLCIYAADRRRAIAPGSPNRRSPTSPSPTPRSTTRQSPRRVCCARRRRPYLREVWRSPHWRLFAVLGARALSPPPTVLTQLSQDSFTLQTPRAGAFTVRVRFTPYWALASGHGCVLRAPGDWTLLRAPSSGSVRVVVDFTLARVFDHGARCR